MTWSFKTSTKLAYLKLMYSVAVLRYNQFGHRVYPYNHALSNQRLMELNIEMTELGRALGGRVTHLGSALAIVKFPTNEARGPFIDWLDLHGFTHKRAGYTDPEAENTRRMDAYWKLQHPASKPAAAPDPKSDPDGFALMDASYEVADAIAGAGDRLGDRVDAAIEKVTDRLEDIDDTLIAHGQHLEDIAEALDEGVIEVVPAKPLAVDTEPLKATGYKPIDVGGGETAYVESSAAHGFMPKMRYSTPASASDVKQPPYRDWVGISQRSVAGRIVVSIATDGRSFPYKLSFDNPLRVRAEGNLYGEWHGARYASIVYVDNNFTFYSFADEKSATSFLYRMRELGFTVRFETTEYPLTPLVAGTMVKTGKWQEYNKGPVPWNPRPETYVDKAWAMIRRGAKQADKSEAERKAAIHDIKDILEEKAKAKAKVAEVKRESDTRYLVVPAADYQFYAGVLDRLCGVGADKDLKISWEGTEVCFARNEDPAGISWGGANHRIAVHCEDIQSIYISRIVQTEFKDGDVTPELTARLWAKTDGILKHVEVSGDR